jgi:iron-sulfur cluster repair protein YtfE (RIC family)
MTHTLPRIAHEHHQRLILHVDTMPAIGDLLLTGTDAELRPRLEELATFLTGTLVPHMDATEPVLYPELERMLQNRHSMTPMRREHAEVRRLVAEYERIRPLTKDAKHSLGRVVALRRVVFQLYALLKVHVAEEELYIRIVDHNLAEDASEVLAAVIDTHPGARH